MEPTRTHLRESLLLILLFIAMLGWTPFFWGANPAPVRASAEGVDLADVIQIDIQQEYAGDVIKIVSSDEVKGWLRYVTISESDLPERKDFGTLTLTITGVPLSANYGGTTLYTGAEVKGSMKFETSTGKHYFHEFKTREDPPSMTFRSSATSAQDAPFDPIALFAVHAEMARMVGEVYGGKPLVSALKFGNTDLMRGAAATALGFLEDPDAVVALIHMLTEWGGVSKTINRIAAAEALGRIGDERAIGPLIDRVGEKKVSLKPGYFESRGVQHPFVSSAAAWALRVITGCNFGRDEERWRKWWVSRSPLPLAKEGRKDNAEPSRTPIKGSFWAVVIGVAKYEFSGKGDLSNLVFADDDARAFVHTLKDLGWNESHIRLLINEDATLRNIVIALESWLSKVGPEDRIVLFWAGHGFADPEDPEKVYFACYDTDVTIPATGYRMDRVRAALKEREAKNVIIFVDTCHAGKLVTRGESRGVSIVPGIRRMARGQEIPKGWIFMVGADTDRQAIEHSSWSNGAFTHLLIKGLSGKADGFQSAGPEDDVITMAELRTYMSTAMPDETQKVLGVAKRPMITTSTGDPGIWKMTLEVSN